MKLKRQSNNYIEHNETITAITKISQLLGTKAGAIAFIGPLHRGPEQVKHPYVKRVKTIIHCDSEKRVTTFFFVYTYFPYFFSRTSLKTSSKIK